MGQGQMVDPLCLSSRHLLKSPSSIARKVGTETPGKEQRLKAHPYLKIIGILILLSILGLPLMPSGCLEERNTSIKRTSTPAISTDKYAKLRHRMVETQLRAIGITDERVLAAMEKVPRHRFVPERYLDEAYADHALPIGYGQVISQPYLVAYMIQLLKLKGREKVLEIGTGSGYQAAILAELADEVYTVEILGSLASQAEHRLQEQGYTNVHVLHADGYFGWKEHSPYDAIIVTCAPDHVPYPLPQQLKDGGRLLIPVAPPPVYQFLWLIEKHGDEIISHNMGGVTMTRMEH